MAAALSIEPLSKAVLRLREGLERYQRDTSDLQVRDGLVQRFEFTYELSHKLLKRYLERASANPDEIDQMPFADQIRTAAEQGLLRSGWPEWRSFREMRGATSHAYDETVALKVVAGIPEFLEEAAFLLSRLEQRIR